MSVQQSALLYKLVQQVNVEPNAYLKKQMRKEVNNMKYLKFMYSLATILLIASICTSLIGCAGPQDLSSSTITPPYFETPEGTIALQTTEETASTIETSSPVSGQAEPSTTGTKHTHCYVSAVTHASCKNGGYTTYSCGCGHTYQTDHTGPENHVYQEKITVVTCTTDGYSTFECSVCLDTYIGNVVKASGHNWSEWTTTREATSTVEGIKQRNCKTCSTVVSQSIAKLPYEPFSGTIGEYNSRNEPYTDWQGSAEQAAFIEVYAVDKSESILESLAKEFERVYGFAPALGDKYRCTSSCEKVGTYMVKGFTEPQTVYHYTILDKSYHYITNEMYKVYTQHCADGSVWVGYCIYATMDTVGHERSKPTVQALDKEMYSTFENLIGLSRNEMTDYKEELSLKIGYISDAGSVRSPHSDGLVHVLYIYCRGFSSK